MSIDYYATLVAGVDHNEIIEEPTQERLEELELSEFTTTGGVTTIIGIEILRVHVGREDLDECPSSEVVNAVIEAQSILAKLGYKGKVKVYLVGEQC